MNDRVDLNCDMGESYGNYIIGNDDEIMPYLTSCNVACGFHGGDPLHIYNTLVNAKKYELKIGAHPGYPDLNGFGRRALEMSTEELKASVIYQISAVIGMAKSLDLTVSYIKPHGAMYNLMAKNEGVSAIVIQAVKEVDPALSIMGLAGSDLADWVAAENMHFIPEAFADRRYSDDGTLIPRSHADAIIYDPGEASAQVLNIIRKSRVQTMNGDFIRLKAESICVHGDNKHAVSILKAIKNVL
ncbi:MAG: LamB/YcsF family protein [Saprospiraceae bacterium]|nr:LamB/YcsF family protein [Saprospiraceae bacterium]